MNLLLFLLLACGCVHLHSFSVICRIPLCKHLTVCVILAGYLYSFQFGLMNILTYVSWGPCAHIFVDSAPSSGLLDYRELRVFIRIYRVVFNPATNFHSH